MLAPAQASGKEAGFKSRVMAGELLVGSFLKSPAIPTVEILAGAGFDFLAIDLEHAPIDRAAAGTMIFATKSLGMGALVRVPVASGEHILSSLDLGADGILAPHVSNPEIAGSVVAAGHYSMKRGYSGSVRSSAYGAAKMAKVVAEADRNVVIVAQIEDAEAMDNLGAIAACDGVDALFIGRGDLAVSLGIEGASSETVWRLTEAIANAAKSAGKIVGGFAENADTALRLQNLGATLIILGSDQSFLRQGARGAICDLRKNSPEP